MGISMKRLIVAAALAAGLCWAGGAAAQNVDTRATATTTVYDFGPSQTQTYGQTITVPAGQSAITSFSFVMSSVPDTFTFEGVIMAWDGTKATGPVLYRSALRSTTGATPQEIIFTPGAPVPVTPGQTYVLFASSVNGTGTGDGHWAAEPSPGSYAGGQYVYTNGASEADWTVDWDMPPYVDTDVGFTVNFAPAVVATVPTMSEWAMILLAVMMAGGAAVYLQRRRLAA